MPCTAECASILSLHARTMIGNAKRWALARGLTRINEIHGLEEFKVPTRETFLFRNEHEQSSTARGSLDIEALPILNPI